MLRDELDMLEAQLFENHDRVHRFIVIEATRTHQGRSKPLFYDASRERFAPWAGKIIHVVCDYLPDAEQVLDHWVRERMQRDAGLAAFMHLTDPDDIIIVSDVDEIPSSAAFAQDPQPYLGGNLYLRFATADTPGSPGVMQVLARAGHVGSVDRLRQVREALPSYDRAGWHLSWFGGQAAIEEKLNSFCHLESYVAGKAANDADLPWRYGIGQVPPGWDGSIVPAPVVKVPWAESREERDALPWEQQLPLWVHQRRCPEVWWRPAEGVPGAVR
jgi:hypothetical protein